MRVAALGVLAVLLVAGCGGGDDEATADSPLLAGPPTLLFSASEGGGSWDIYVEDVASRKRTNLTNTPGRVGASRSTSAARALSRDGRLIAYTSTADHAPTGPSRGDLRHAARREQRSAG